MKKQNVVPFIRKRPQFSGDVAVKGSSRNDKHRYAGKVARRKAAEWARDMGIDVGGFELSPDGSIRIYSARAAPQAPMSDFDRYEHEL